MGWVVRCGAGRWDGGTGRDIVRVVSRRMCMADGSPRLGPCAPTFRAHPGARLPHGPIRTHRRISSCTWISTSADDGPSLRIGDGSSSCGRQGGRGNRRKGPQSLECARDAVTRPIGRCGRGAGATLAAVHDPASGNPDMSGTPDTAERGRPLRRAHSSSHNVRFASPGGSCYHCPRHASIRRGGSVS